MMGFIVDDTGKIVNMDDLGMDNLKPQLEKMLSGYQGTWSVYVKDLNEEKEILINDTSLYSASLIKAFVMAKTYEDMEQVKADEAKKLNTADTKTVDVKLNDLLWNMITVSDNESCNELVKLQTDSLDFKKGAEDINKYLEKEGYTETSVQHTLHPAASAQESLGGRNMTSVKDCGTLLEKNLQEGMCQQRGVRRNVKSSVKSGKHLENPPGTSGWNKICQQDRRDRPGSARYRNCLWRKDNLYPMCDV